MGQLSVVNKVTNIIIKQVKRIKLYEKIKRQHVNDTSNVTQQKSGFYSKDCVGRRPLLLVKPEMRHLKDKGRS